MRKTVLMVVTLTASAAVLSLAAAASAAPTSPDMLTARPGVVTIPAGTGIWLSFVRELSSKNVRVGDTFPMQVARDVYVRHVLVIPRGSEATGRINYRTGQGVFGKSAKIEFDIVDVQVGHKQLQVAGGYRIAGNGNSGATVVAALTSYVIGGFFITGHSAKVPAGAEWRAATTSPMQVAFDDVESLPLAQADGWTGLAASQRTAAQRAGMGEREIAANGAYTPPPAEILIRSLPARP